LKTLCIAALIFSLFLVPVARYNVIPHVLAENPATVTTASTPRVYSQAEIDEMTARTVNPYILRKLIKCESENTNIARMDSNHQISFGILQFNGTSTWADFAPRAGVIHSTPMNPMSAIKVADWMISNGFLGRWTCARIQNLL
jgi:hypothetical protein